MNYQRGKTYDMKPDGWLDRFESERLLAQGLGVLESVAEQRLRTGRALGHKNLLWIFAEQKVWYCPVTLDAYITREKKRIERKSVSGVLDHRKWN